jgi:Fic family protein
MKRGLTGQFEITPFEGEQVKAFVPNPLPPTPEVEMTAARRRLLEHAEAALAKLDGAALHLPEIDLFLYAYVRKEAVLSSQIEGTQSTLSDLMLFELDDFQVPVDDVKEVSSYVAAMEHGLSRLKDIPLSGRLIREMHEKLMAKGRGSEKEPGEFRRSQNWIGGQRPSLAHYVPPPPHEVSRCMGDLDKFIHAEDGMPTLIRAALAHVQFESIHPFLDGNGRIGRLIIALLLQQSGKLSRPLLYLSLYLKANKTEYYRLLDKVRADGDWEAWVDFFLKGVAQTADSAALTARKLTDCYLDDLAKVQKLGRSGGKAAGALGYFRKRPILDIKGVAAALDTNFPAATRAIQALVNSGILHETTGKARNRVFVYQRYIEILNES